MKLKEDTKHAHKVLMAYHLSEKTNAFAGQGSYVFKVARDANKIEVKKAIESVYDVHVNRVNIISVKGKHRRIGRSVGRTSDWKKAIVTLRPGEKISGLAEGI
ncbi:MAG TPA: 50S ribosomal protein L23 [Verrucomicrobiae bacterium]|nr:50S ribosomal protein L23 [Verrucomicrobiae bacterium]